MQRDERHPSPAATGSTLLLATADAPFAGAEVLGLACGNVVMSRNVGRDLMASLKTIVGGEVGAWTSLMTEARDIAQARMEERARALGANAVTGVRFSSHALDDAVEILAYGTAVRLG